jgi:hypothetical protein
MERLLWGFALGRKAVWRELSGERRNPLVDHMCLKCFKRGSKMDL